MENLAIEATKQTPKVNFDAENYILEFKGESYPENTALFMVPILTWLKQYLEQLGDQNFALNIELTYFNSSSSKMLLNLFEQLEAEVEDNNKNIVVNWIYDAEDYNIEEFGEEFQEDLEFLTFNLVKKNDG